MRILVVEDDKKVGAFLQRGLREEQYAVDLCCDGAEAVYEAQTHSYDVIILDIMLPGKDGFAVCRELRENSVLTPILMLTAKDSLDDKIIGLSEGADDYLRGPGRHGGGGQRDAHRDAGHPGQRDDQPGDGDGDDPQ